MRLSKWTKARLDALIEKGTFRTLGGAIDQLIKQALATDGNAQWKVTVPENHDEIHGYYPIMAKDMAPGVWSSLNETERRLCVLVAFFPCLNDVEMARWAHTTPAVVKHFKVSDLGLESVRIGEQRGILSERLRFWRKTMLEAEDPEHPLSKQSHKLLGDKLFAPPKKHFWSLAMEQDPTGQRPMVTNPHQVDTEFMDYAESIQMTPERFIQLTARRAGISVKEIVIELVHRFLQQQPLPDQAENESALNRSQVQSLNRTGKSD
jgi:hypothetical protein